MPAPAQLYFTMTQAAEDGIAQMKISPKLLGAALLTAMTAPAQAHHSAAMFDMTKNVTLNGTIKDFLWRNPHAGIELVAMDTSSGKMEEWAIECSTPNILIRRGWALHSLNPGDKVVLVMHPMKDGGKAGLVMTVTTPGGAVLKDHDY